ncbi:MAG: phosphopantothenoylcysteine decarboxylase [Planctomycetes bacterium]|nr:phosphopantothenoylcysteine decarboxylase [Planctomycetota bacterium]
MARILITSGPTRQYLDPVRYLTNGSSGRMGAALADAALRLGHHVVLVSGPVHVLYPDGCERINVVTTEEMLAACQTVFPRCDGVIGAAAPCDYRPLRIEEHKISKTGAPLMLQLLETTDIVASLGASKTERQWSVGFALETDEQRFRGLTKLLKKSCDLMVVNGPQAMNSEFNAVEILDRTGQVVQQLQGPKEQVAQGILSEIQARLISVQPLKIPH